MCLTDPSNDQLVKDEGAQIFYSIRSQTKPIGIGTNCEISHNAAPTTRTYDQALIPLVGPCALPIHPTTNWWRMKGHKSFIAFDRKLSPLVFERIVKSLTILFAISLNTRIYWWTCHLLIRYAPIYFVPCCQFKLTLSSLCRIWFLRFHMFSNVIAISKGAFSGKVTCHQFYKTPLLTIK